MPPETVEVRVRKLGYGVRRKNGTTPAAARPVEEPSWFATTKGRLVLGTGALLAGAWDLLLAAPEAETPSSAHRDELVPAASHPMNAVD